MQFLTRDELRRLFQAAYDHNRQHHLCLVTMFWSGLRVSETLAIRGRDIVDGQLSVKRLKKSRPTIHALKRSDDPLFDQSPLLAIAAHNPGRSFTAMWRNTQFVFCSGRKREISMRSKIMSDTKHQARRWSTCARMPRRRHSERLRGS